MIKLSKKEAQAILSAFLKVPGAAKALEDESIPELLYFINSTIPVGHAPTVNALQDLCPHYLTISSDILLALSMAGVNFNDNVFDLGNYLPEEVCPRGTDFYGIMSEEGDLLSFDYKPLEKLCPKWVDKGFGDELFCSSKEDADKLGHMLKCDFDGRVHKHHLSVRKGPNYFYKVAEYKGIPLYFRSVE